MSSTEKNHNETTQNTAAQDAMGKKSTPGIISIILRGIALAMGVAVITMSWLDKENADTAILMLGIGLMCLAIDSMQRRENEPPANGKQS